MSLLKVNNITDLGDDPVLTDGVLDVTPPAILQVVSTTKTDTFTASTSTYTDITGASLTITPSSASSKIWVSFSTVTGTNGFDTHNFALLRNGTAVGGGTPAGSRVSAIAKQYNAGNGTTWTIAAQYLDSPAATSAITYKVQVRGDGSSTIYIGRDSTDNDSSSGQNARTPFTITAMEVAG